MVLKHTSWDCISPCSFPRVDPLSVHFTSYSPTVWLWGCLGGDGADVSPLRRHKRDWIVPTAALKENLDYTKEGYVARIRSDKDEQDVLYYSLRGPGASLDPVNLFVVGEDSGLVYVRGTLDREERETYILTGIARLSNGDVAESRIDLKFEVEDENDNPPVFGPVPPATIYESSPAGTLVGIIQATDADKANCSHSKIAYSIVKQEPFDGKDLFYIDRETGSIYVSDNSLDRETQSSYILTVKGIDLNGAPDGNTGTGAIQITVLDINDNVPTLEKDQYAGSIVENTADVEVMRFKVLDADEDNTDNWLSVFDIVSGNEDGIFSIKTDPKTNEGVLMLEKPVDFETNPGINLGVVVSNVAPAGAGGGAGGGAGAGAGGGAAGGGAGGGGATGAGAGTGVGTGKRPTKRRPKTGKRYPVSIAVLNEPEGVAFKPAVKPVSVSENPEEIRLMEVIAVFPATDTDTGELAENVRYAKGDDPDNWLLIDPETAEIKLQKAPDRESPFLVNGTYYAKILSLTQEVPPRMVTGTIALQVGDINDNCPTLASHTEYICLDTEVINVTAVDEDADPNSAPFSFRLVAEESEGEWRHEPLNDTSTSLRALKPLWPGHYKVTFIIEDQQGLACPDPQQLDLHACSCEGADTCRELVSAGRVASLKETSSSLGGLGVGAVILGLLMLLIVGFLLTTCSCGEVSGSFTELPFDTLEHLIVYHTEGRGENKDVPTHISPVQLSPPAISAARANNVASNNKDYTSTSFWSVKMGSANKSYMSRYGANGRILESSAGEFRGSQREMYSMEEQLLEDDGLDGMAVSDEFLHQYYSQKASCVAGKQAAVDCLREYDYEGQGSSAGSVGCCSLLESGNDLQFLEDLGPKFKTLAQICSPPRPSTPLTQSILPPEVDKGARVAVPPSQNKPLSIHSEIPKQNQNVVISRSASCVTGFDKTSASSKRVKTSTNSVGFNGAASCSMHGQSSHRAGNTCQSPHISPVTTAMLPSPGQMLLLQQQPVYFTTSPVMQPMHYIIQPQLQSTVLLEDDAFSNQQGVIVHGGNTTGTLAFGRTSGYTEIMENREMGTLPRSYRPEKVMGGWRRGGRIVSDGGASAGQCNVVMLTGRQMSVGAAGSEEAQLVFPQSKNKSRSRSVASAETRFMY
ncbi:desmoglein-2.1-like [Centropristis striata]|uniref:desmoglein-2.1-like n=1 Tax=Centropristis striata TaxID=184440 RepID=UPI0027E02EFA|nr:desmoglein-2.1-like [Centropristis striata]